MPRLLQQRVVHRSSGLFHCKLCGQELAGVSDVVSRDFTGHTGPAILFDNVVNVVEGPAEPRRLQTGQHVVANISCLPPCSHVVGWMYIKCPQDQAYKLGKAVMEVR